MASSAGDSRAAVERAAALLAANPRQAERDALAVLKGSPREPGAALVLGSARRRQGDIAGALEILRPLATAFPRAALTQFELGAALAAAGETQGALKALRDAVALNPNNADAWRTLGDVLFSQGDARGAEDAFRRHRRAAIADPRLQPAAAAICEGRLSEAEQLLRQTLRARPDDPPALQMLAEVLIAQKLHADAEILLRRSLDLAPENHGARFDYAVSLFHQQKGAEAVLQLERLAAAGRADAAHLNLMAGCLEQVGDFERALAIYEGLLVTHVRQPLLWLNYGHMLRTVGRQEDAARAYRRAVELDPAQGEAYLGLANLGARRLRPSDAQSIRGALEQPGLSRKDRAYLHFALGRALEAAGDAAGAFASIAQGAALRRVDNPYDPEQFTGFVRSCMQLWSEDFFAERAGFGLNADDPIFIVGLHRSGSTLVEQILASHSAIEGTMELTDLGLIARRFGWSDPNAPPYPALTARLDAAQSKALGEGYLAATRIHRRLGRRHFIDKMPNNFQHLGLIQLILPRARIIDVRRHPLGACVSAFRQHWADAQPFTYDLVALGRYYRDYVELMDHVDQALPGRVHRIIYEDLVGDTETEIRRLLGYCGLAFEAACLDFSKNDRAVRTVSSEQVRRPIYREGLDAWRRYEPWLGPLEQALGPALETWRGRKEARP